MIYLGDTMNVGEILTRDDITDGGPFPPPTEICICNCIRNPIQLIQPSFKSSKAKPVDLTGRAEVERAPPLKRDGRFDFLYEKRKMIWCSIRRGHEYLKGKKRSG